MSSTPLGHPVLVTMVNSTSWDCVFGKLEDVNGGTVVLNDVRYVRTYNVSPHAYLKGPNQHCKAITDLGGRVIIRYSEIIYISEEGAKAFREMATDKRFADDDE